MFQFHNTIVHSLNCYNRVYALSFFFFWPRYIAVVLVRALELCIMLLILVCYFSIVIGLFLDLLIKCIKSLVMFFMDPDLRVNRSLLSETFPVYESQTSKVLM